MASYHNKGTGCSKRMMMMMEKTSLRISYAISKNSVVKQAQLVED